MSDYLKREDVVRILSERNAAWNAYEMVVILPAADAVEVIRCRDCRFFHPDTYSDNWCSAKSPGVTKGMCTPSGDSYCSDAERRIAQDV